MSAKEFGAEMERAKRYGATRSKALGIASEKELNDDLYATPSPSPRAGAAKDVV